MNIKVDSTFSELFSNDGQVLIAGPCSAESEEQLLNTALELKKLGQVNLLRAGIWKPRTRPNSFEGHGEVALPWLLNVKKETGFKTAIEVANAKQVELALKYDVDVLWIGARSTVNPFTVQEIADALSGLDIPVMVKNPINPDLALWIGAFERLSGRGLNKLIAIHRGFATYEKGEFRNNPLWKIPLELKRRCPDLPLICDPSHITGNKNLIQKVSQKALDLDYQGLMIETHIDPSCALSDKEQQITPRELANILSELVYKREISDDHNFEEEIDALRCKIDRIDNELIDLLSMRAEISEKMGKAKKEMNVTAFQRHRLDELLEKRKNLAEQKGLNPDFIHDLFDVIHTESVNIQTEIIQN